MNNTENQGTSPMQAGSPSTPQTPSQQQPVSLYSSRTTSASTPQTQATTPLPVPHQQTQPLPQQTQNQYASQAGAPGRPYVSPKQSQYPQINRPLPSQQRHYAAPPNPYQAPYPYSPVTQSKNYGYPNNAYGYPYQPAQTPPAPPQKNGWSSGIFALIAVVALIFGGIVGAGVVYGLQSDDNAQSVPNDNNSWNAEPDYGDGVFGDDGSDPYFPNDIGDNSSGSDVTSAPGVLIINSMLTNGIGAGSGMIISSDGYAITNYHVVEGSTTVRVTVADTKRTYDATVLGHDASVDIALLKLEDAKNLDYVKFDTSTPEKGENISVVGNAAGQGYLSQLKGKITATNQDITAMAEGGSERLKGLIKTNADVVQGYSGGPMFNKSGKVIGVIVAASSAFGHSGDTDGYAIPAKDAMRVVTQIKTGESKGTTIVGPNAALGVMVSDEELKGSSHNESGATVVQVSNGSAAEKAGISAGDVITSVDDKPINSASDLSKLIKTYSVDDTIKVTYVDSSGHKETIKVKLGKSPVN